jgi:hypothetical protein
MKRVMNILEKAAATLSCVVVMRCFKTFGHFFLSLASI